MLYRVYVSSDGGNTWVPFTGGQAAAGTATSSNVAGSASSVTLLAANPMRVGFTMFNESTSIVYVKLGATASNASYTKQLLPNDFWSSAMLGFNYTGRIDAIWASGVGNMRVTEMSA